MPKFLSPIDLTKNELQNARIQNLASAPGSPVEGQVYYDTALHKFQGRTDTTWVDMQGGGTVASVTAGDGSITVAGTSSDPTVAVASGGITNTHVNGSAAIAYSKLALTNSILNADVASGAAIAYSKLNLGTSIVNGDVAAGAAIAYSKLALTGSIVNADVASGAAIAYAKLNLTGAIVDADIANVSGSKVNAGTVAATYLPALNAITAPTADVSLNSHKITNLLDPTSDQDAATKAYVDAARAGLDVKASVRAATTGPGTLATSFENGDSIDGVTLATGDRILIKDQASGSENGVYTVNASGAPTRATDADANAEVTGGMFVFVEEGTANADSGFVLTNNGAVTVGTTALTFVQFSGAGQITAGDGLTKSGNTIDAVGTADRITVGADAIDIASTYAGQTSIVTLGTVTTGTWSATTIALNKGGTGATTAAAARGNLGATGVYSAAGTGTASTFTITQATHGLGTSGNGYMDLDPTCWDKSANPAVRVFPDIGVNTSTGDVTFTFAASQTLSNYQFTIIGK